MNRAPCAWVVCVVAWASAADAGTIGTMADWEATPLQVEFDQEALWLADSGNWDSTELLTLSKNIPLASVSLGLVSLSSYVGPITLSVSYEMSITSSDVFQSAALSMNVTGTNTLAYKDIFPSYADLIANPTPGTGTWTLFVENGADPPEVPLPMLQHIWVRDTIILDSSGSLFGISNTFVQIVPEPGAAALLAFGAGGAALWRWRGRRRQPAAFQSHDR
jgi:hypothetical protein